MPCCYNTTRVFVLFFLLIGLVAVVLAGVLDFWWKIQLKDNFGNTVSQEIGLWRRCGGVNLGGYQFDSCKIRNDLFKFDKDNALHFNLDIILASLVGSSFFTLISLIMIAISMCQKYPSKCLVIFHLLFVLIGAGGGIFGVVWATLKIDVMVKDWAFYVLYGANGSLVLSFILSLFLLCARAPGYYLVKRSETV